MLFFIKILKCIVLVIVKTLKIVNFSKILFITKFRLIADKRIRDKEKFPLYKGLMVCFIVNQLVLTRTMKYYILLIEFML